MGWSKELRCFTVPTKPWYPKPKGNKPKIRIPGYICAAKRKELSKKEVKIVPQTEDRNFVIHVTSIWNNREVHNEHFDMERLSHKQVVEKIQRILINWGDTRKYKLEIK